MHFVANITKAIIPFETFSAVICSGFDLPMS